MIQLLLLDYITRVPMLICPGSFCVIGAKGIVWFELRKETAAS